MKGFNELDSFVIQEFIETLDFQITSKLNDVLISDNLEYKSRIDIEEQINFLEIKLVELYRFNDSIISQMPTSNKTYFIEFFSQLESSTDQTDARILCCKNFTLANFTESLIQLTVGNYNTVEEFKKQEFVIALSYFEQELADKNEFEKIDEFINYMVLASRIIRVRKLITSLKAGEKDITDDDYSNENEKIRENESNLEIIKDFLQELTETKYYNGNKIADGDFQRLINYTEYLVEKDKLPNSIDKIPKTPYNNNEITYVYSKIHDHFNEGKSIKKDYILFLYKVFKQFEPPENLDSGKNYRNTTAYKKFRNKPNSF